MGVEPGWYDDPRDASIARWHDGTAWTITTVVKAGYGDVPPPVPPAPAPLPPPPPAPLAPARPAPAPKKGELAPLIPIVFVVGMFLLYVFVFNKSDGGESDSPSESATSCAELRDEWNEVVALDFDRAEELREDYTNRGCKARCGGLVEDTDTPVRETRSC